MAVPISDFSNGVLGVTIYNLSDGTLQIEMLTTSDGDWATLTGIQRLQQDVTLFLYKKIGSDPYDPTLGNGLLDYLGTSFDNDAIATSILSGSLAQFQQRQAQQVSDGQLTTDEQMASFDILYLNFNDGLLTINMTVTSVTEITSPVSAIIPATT